MPACAILFADQKTSIRKAPGRLLLKRSDGGSCSRSKMQNRDSFKSTTNLCRGRKTHRAAQKKASNSTQPASQPASQDTAPVVNIVHVNNAHQSGSPVWFALEQREPSCPMASFSLCYYQHKKFTGECLPPEETDYRPEPPERGCFSAPQRSIWFVRSMSSSVCADTPG